MPANDQPSRRGRPTARRTIGRVIAVTLLFGLAATTLAGGLAGESPASAVSTITDAIGAMSGLAITMLVVFVPIVGGLLWVRRRPADEDVE